MRVSFLVSFKTGAEGILQTLLGPRNKNNNTETIGARFEVRGPGIEPEGVAAPRDTRPSPDPRIKSVSLQRILPILLAASAAVKIAG